MADPVLSSAQQQAIIRATQAQVVALQAALNTQIATLQTEINNINSVSSSAIWRPLVRALSGSNIADLSAASVVVDGVTCVAGDEILLTGQTDHKQNGAYVFGAVTTGTAALTRASWMSTPGDFSLGMRIPVGPEGTSFAGVVIEFTTTGAVVVGTTNLTFAPSTVTSLSGTAPIVVSGGAAKTASISAATTSAAGSLSAVDKTKLDSMTSGAAVASVTGTAPIASSGGTTPAISIAAATGSAAGSMSAADKTKLDAATSDPSANAIPIRGASGEIKAASLDSGATADLGLYRNNVKIVGLTSTGWLFPSTLATPTWAQSAAAAGSPPQSMTFSPQAPDAAATAGNQTPGGFAINFAAPTNGGTAEAHFSVSRSGQLYFSAGKLDSSSAAALWIGPFTPTTTNYTFLGNGGDVTVNAPTTLYLAIGGTFAAITATTSAITFANTTWSLAAGTTITAAGNVSIAATSSTLTLAGSNVDIAGATKIDGCTVALTATTVAAATTTVLDLSKGNDFVVTMGANIATLTLNNPVSGVHYTFEFIQDGTGSRTLAKPGSWKVAGGTFALSSGKTNTSDIITMKYDGTNFKELGRTVDVH